MKTMHSMMHYNNSNTSTNNNNTKTTSTIAFIQKLKPFEIIKNNTKLPLYDLIKIRKQRLSPSPINNHNRKQSSLIITHNNTNNSTCSVKKHNKNNKCSIMDDNCVNTNNNSNNNEYIVVKKEMKVIKDFSKYKKKSRRNIKENEKKINNKRNINYNTKTNKVGCKSEGVQELIKGINIGLIKGNKCDYNGIYNFFKNRPVFMKQPLKMGGDQEPNIDEL
jgi:hypothetical protein